MKFAGTAMITHDSAKDFCTEINKVLHDIDEKGLISEVHYEPVATSGGIVYSALIICRKKEENNEQV